jgi:hypothetical protein
MVQSPELPGILHRHHILYVLYHAYDRGVPRLITAYLAQRGITDTVTNTAVTHIIPEPDDCFAETADFSAVTPQQVHHKPEGGLAAYAGEGGKLIHGLFEQS